MSKQFSKHRSSQQKNLAAQTWSPGGNLDSNFFSKLARPPRRINQQFMTTQHQQQQSKQLFSPFDSRQKPHQHRRRGSQNYQPQAQQSQTSQPLFYNPVKSNGTPKLQRNQSNKGVGDSSKNIQQRFKQIESIMGFQNENLRQQKDYLLRTILKMQIKQKQIKNQMAQQQQRILQLQQQNQILRDRYEKARNFISSGIGKMQQVISKQPVQNNISNSNTAHHSNQSSVNLQQQIQQLNDKFDALMYQYQKTRQPQIRKKCMGLAKQLRKMRKMQQGIKSKNILQNKI